MTLCNLHATDAQPLTVNLGGAFSSVTGRTLTADTLDTHNTAANPNAVTPKPLEGITLSEGTLTLEIPARSVTALTLTLDSGKVARA